MCVLFLKEDTAECSGCVDWTEATLGSGGSQVSGEVRGHSSLAGVTKGPAMLCYHGIPNSTQVLPKASGNDAGWFCYVKEKLTKMLMNV